MSTHVKQSIYKVWFSDRLESKKSEMSALNATISNVSESSVTSEVSNLSPIMEMAIIAPEFVNLVCLLSAIYGMHQACIKHLINFIRRVYFSLVQSY